MKDACVYMHRVIIRLARVYVYSEKQAFRRKAIAIKDFCKIPATFFPKYSPSVKKTHNSWDWSWSWFCFSVCQACLSKRCFPLAAVSAPPWHFREHNGPPGPGCSEFGLEIVCGTPFSLSHSGVPVSPSPPLCSITQSFFLKLRFKL